MAKIVLTQGDHKGREIELPETGLVIGRDNDCGLSLNDSEVSRHHAKLVFEGGGWQLQDLDSANGTVVNNDAVTTVVLKENDVVSIGGTLFIFKNGTSVSAQKTPAPAPVKPASVLAPAAAPAKPAPVPAPAAAPAKPAPVPAPAAA
ncbi:MAG: FHA domain-containing protein, partial [bacterium]